jgi:hypothetical protein
MVATDKAHVREVVRKANKIVGWMCLGNSMVESMLMYGAEIWGWKEQEEVERVQEKYLRWVLGVNRETPHSEGRVPEEQAESESGKESGKVRGQNGRKERVQDTV